MERKDVIAAAAIIGVIVGAFSGWAIGHQTGKQAAFSAAWHMTFEGYQRAKGEGALDAALCRRKDVKPPSFGFSGSALSSWGFGYPECPE